MTTAIPVPKGSLAAPIASIAIVGLVLSLSTPLLAFEMEARGISPFMMGLNTAVAGLANIVIAPFVPGLMRRFGFKPLLASMVLLGAATLIAFKPAPFWAWFPLRFLTGVAIGVLFIVSEYWINAVAPAHKRGLIMGIYATVLSLGFAVGPSVLLVTGTQGYLPYLAGVGILVVAVIPILATSGLPPALEKRSGVSGIWTAMLAIPAATLAGLVFGAIETSEFTFWPVYGLASGMTPELAALLVTAAALGNLVLQIPMGWLADRMDKRLLLALIAAVAALAAALMIPLSSSLTGIFVLVVISGGVAGGLYTVGLALLGARATGAALAQANAAFVMLYSIGMIAGPPVTGAAMDLWEPHGLPAAMAAILGAYALFVLVRRAMWPDSA
jgi:MFS family permease